MDEATEPPDEPDEGDEDTSDDGGTPPVRSFKFGGGVPSLNAFASIQRMVASIDFSAIQAAQRSIESAGGLERFADAQEAIVSHFARSVDFSGMAAVHRAIAGTGIPAEATAAQKQWAETLAKSIDFSALNSAVMSSAALDAWARTSERSNETLRQQTELFARIAQSAAYKLPKADVSRLLAALDRWLPSNLRDIDALEVVATISLEEGLPLSWVPRAEIVILLIEAADRAERLAIVTQRRDDILDDCETALSSMEHEWAVQCRSAVAAMRAGLDGPAQSHASNIVDSIVLALLGSNGREHAKSRAQEDFDDLPLQLAAENLTLRPLLRAFTPWFPNRGTEPPTFFARHATSHAVGHAGVFVPTSALVAVMLASSLAAQFAPSERSSEGTGSEQTP